MATDIGPYVGSLLRKHFSGYDKPVSIEKSAGTVDLSQTMRKDADLDPSLYASQTIGGHPDYDHLRFSDDVVPGKIVIAFRWLSRALLLLFVWVLAVSVFFYGFCG